MASLSHVGAGTIYNCITIQLFIANVIAISNRFLVVYIYIVMSVLVIVILFGCISKPCSGCERSVKAQDDIDPCDFF